MTAALDPAEQVLARRWWVIATWPVPRPTFGVGPLPSELARDYTCPQHKHGDSNTCPGCYERRLWREILRHQMTRHRLTDGEY